MILVNTYVKYSPINGLGLFAAEDINRGDLIWQYNSFSTQTFWKKKFFQLCKESPLPAIHHLITYSYLKNGNVYYLNDSGKYINHSENPNTAMKDEHSQIAISDIKKDEEITENYQLTYDLNDFYYLNISKENTKLEILEILKNELLPKTLPKTRFI